MQHLKPQFSIPSMMSYMLGLVILILCNQVAFATHNRAGEITYVQTGDLTIDVVITTYTKASSTDADRDTLTIDWGDGTTSNLPRTNGFGQGEVLPGDIKYNIYRGTHTYPGRATYTISMEDPNRIGNIENINNGNSISVRFYIETTITFLNPQFQAYNRSAILLQPPIDEGCVGQRFIHSPGAFDPDGDSLSFELVSPLQSMGEPVNDYLLPDRIAPGPTNQIFFNSDNGEFIWDAPALAGEYNIAIKISEFRNGVLINTIIRDMQINIKECDNRPPEVFGEDLICVIAGTSVVEDITVTDPDQNQLVRVEASGGPFQVALSPATFDAPIDYVAAPQVGRFEWNTTCSHILRNDYTAIFKGQDDYFKSTIDTTGLVDLHNLAIHVSGPPPIDFQAESQDGMFIQLDWEAPYYCELDNDDDYFRGFTIWRKLEPTEVVIDTCGTYLEDYGYVRIGSQVLDKNGDRFFYIDETVEKGITYCYRVTAEFARLSPGGIPYNRVQSLPSDEICLQVLRDIPLITHVTVDSTDDIDGQMTIKWVAPLAKDLDTVMNPGPYRYVLLRSDGIGTTDFSPLPGADFTATTFADLVAIDSFVDRTLNTADIGYTYAIDFYATDLTTPYDRSRHASSVFLSTIGSDRKVELTWDFDVPWFIDYHAVYRLDQSTGLFDSIGLSMEPAFIDINRTNEIEYCYRIKSVGSYGLQDIPSPQENYSEISCAVPVDSVPPCTPALTVTNNCEELNDEPIAMLVNNLSWNFASGCEDSTDVAIIQVYFISALNGDTTLIESVDDPLTRSYIHTLPPEESGCYYVRAIDVNGNISDFSPIACSEVCPFYELPNVFTPNGDGANDVFTPFPYRFITRVEMKIYSRWGNLIFETTDPAINWNGNDLNGNEASEDVYYYTCRVFSGSPTTGLLEEDFLKGNITLVRD